MAGNARKKFQGLVRIRKVEGSIPFGSTIERVSEHHVHDRHVVWVHSKAPPSLRGVGGAFSFSSKTVGFCTAKCIEDQEISFQLLLSTPVGRYRAGTHQVPFVPYHLADVV